MARKHDSKTKVTKAMIAEFPGLIRVRTVKVVGSSPDIEAKCGKAVLRMNLHQAAWEAGGSGNAFTSAATYLAKRLATAVGLKGKLRDLGEMHVSGSDIGQIFRAD